jgi:hypothetical protein
LQDPPKFAQIEIFGLNTYMPSGNPGTAAFIVTPTCTKSSRRVGIRAEPCASDIGAGLPAWPSGPGPELQVTITTYMHPDTFRRIGPHCFSNENLCCRP